MLCFEYQKRRYVADGQSLSTIYLYDPNKTSHFSPAFYLSDDELFVEVIHTKFYHSLEDGNCVGHDLGEVEYTAISKTRQQFIEIIEFMKTEKFPQYK